MSRKQEKLKVVPVSKKLNGPWSALLRGAYKKTPQKHLKCPRCLQSFGNEGALQRHLSAKHIEEPSKDKIESLLPKLRERKKRKLPTPGPKEDKAPTPKRPRNFKTRKRLPNITKKKLLLEYESLEDYGQRLEWLQEHQLTVNNIKTWKRPNNRSEIMKAGSWKSKTEKTSDSHREKRKVGLFPEQQKTLYNMYRVRRAEGLTVKGIWLTGKMRELLEKDKPPKYNTFKGSDHWIANFVRRWGISNQRQTNKKAKSVEARLPQVRRFHQYAVYQMALEKP